MPVMEHEITELRERIAHLEGQVEFLFKHLGVTFVPEAAPGDDPRIIEQLKQGDLLGAVRIHREINKSDYITARQAVDEIKGRLVI